MRHLQRTLMFGLSLLMSIGAIAGGVGFSYKTVDDSAMISQYLNHHLQNGEILGANSRDQKKPGDCPDSEPVIGWIDFRGNKLIKNDLNNDQSPSACFKTNEEANEAGYYLND